jgi:hypothetical protein
MVLPRQLQYYIMRLSDTTAAERLNPDLLCHRETNAALSKSSSRGDGPCTLPVMIA